MLLSSTGPSWTHHLVVAFQLFFESLRPVARLLAIFFFMVSSHCTPNCSANTWLTVLTFMIIRRSTFKDKVLSVLASFIIFYFLLARKGCGRRYATLIGKGSGSISTSHSGKSEQCVQSLHCEWLSSGFNIVTLVHMEKLGYNPVFTLVSSHVWRCTLWKVFFLASPAYVLVEVPAYLVAENFRTVSTPSVPANPVALVCVVVPLYLMDFLSSIRCVCLVRQRIHALPFLAAFCSVPALTGKYRHFWILGLLSGCIRRVYLVRQWIRFIMAGICQHREAKKFGLFWK